MAGKLATALDDALRDVVERGIIIGADIAVVRNGVALYRKAWGWQDRELGRAMSSGAIFRYASLTKAIVSATALRLGECGVIALDAPVARYLPEFLPSLPSGERPVIRITHLLSHTAGLSYGFLQDPDGPYRRAGVSDGLDGPGISNEDNLRRIASVPLFYSPGSRWGYSVASDVLGAVIERVTQSDLASVVRALVTEPLRMYATSFQPDDRKRICTPYRDGDPVASRMADEENISVGSGVARFVPDRAWIPGTGYSGGAGLFGNVDDYVRFLETIRLGGAPILSRESTRLMTSSATGDLAVLPPGPGWGFGLGVAVLNDPTEAEVPHAVGTWHWSGAYGNCWFVDPVAELTVVLLTNTAFAGMAGNVPDVIRKIIYREL
jgi:CubicO group peptidase (beta-lactamase class C family)